MASYDFHLHSAWSYDATASLEYYFREAARLELKAIAITEHHHMDSYAEIADVATIFPEVTFIPGAELTVSSPLGTFDMVCLGLPMTPPPELEAVFEKYHQWQRDYGDAWSRVMTKQGHAYSQNDRLHILRQYRPSRTIVKQGITHVQNEVQTQHFIDQGFINNSSEMSKVWENKELYNEFPAYPEANDVLPIVKKCGGLVFIAHPRHYFYQNDLKRMDALREYLKFDGIECAHPSVAPELTACYRDYCQKHKLLSSGGTDCHVDADYDPLGISQKLQLAEHIGEDRWLDEITERL